MSYIDQTYGSALEQALRGLTSRPALGQPWFGFHASEVPAGVLLYTASTHSRVLYADFWQHVQNKGLVKTEAEWQSIYLSQGWCPFYSDGDGIDTFRMPSAPLYLHGAAALDEAGTYVPEGLPNITGRITATNGTGYQLLADQATATGVFSLSEWGGKSGISENSTSGWGYDYFDFDASRSNAIYGKSDHVTPATSKLLFGVWAIAVPQTPIPDAIAEGILSSLELKANTDLSNLSPAGRNLGAGLGMPSSRYIDLELGASGSVYTAPAAGYYYFSKVSTAGGQYVVFENASDAMPGETVAYTAYTSGYVCSIIRAVTKGTTVQLRYSAGGATIFFRFVYAEGAE